MSSAERTFRALPTVVEMLRRYRMSDASTASTAMPAAVTSTANRILL